MKSNSITGVIGALWGGIGVTLLLGSAIFRLTPIVIDALSHPLLWYHFLLLILNILYMAYAEGYQAFQKNFSPRVVARAKYLKSHPNLMHAILAPLFCMGYFHATRKRKIVSISVSIGVIILIILVRLLKQPWRGIVDAGVVVGLVWGVVAILVSAVQAFVLQDFDYPPEVPEEA